MANSRSFWLSQSWLALLVAGCTGAPKQLPPRAAPARVAPNVSMPTQPPAVGHARVVLGTTDGPMRIEARGDLEFAASGHERPSRFGDLCTTPCVVDLPIGKYKLYMTSQGATNQGDVDVITVREGVNYYLRAPGKFEPPQWIHVWPTLLGASGVVLFATGAAYALSSDTGAQVPGGLLMAAGVAVTTAGGIILYDASRGSTQQGASTSWWEPASSR